jgi:hypothetical protein
MKFSSFFNLALIGTAIAAPSQLLPRDLNSILASFKEVEITIKAFDAALTAVDKSKLASELPKIGGKGDVILSTLLSVNGKIRESGSLTSDEAITLAKSAYALSGVSSGTIERLIKEKAIFEKGGAAPSVLKQLKAQKVATLDMITIFTSKIPAELKQYAVPAAKLATDAL